MKDFNISVPDQVPPDVSGFFLVCHECSAPLAVCCDLKPGSAIEGRCLLCGQGRPLAIIQAEADALIAEVNAKAAKARASRHN